MAHDPLTYVVFEISLRAVPFVMAFFGGLGAVVGLFWFAAASVLGKKARTACISFLSLLAVCVLGFILMPERCFSERYISTGVPFVMAFFGGLGAVVGLFWFAAASVLGKKARTACIFFLSLLALSVLGFILMPERMWGF